MQLWRIFQCQRTRHLSFEVSGNGNTWKTCGSNVPVLLLLFKFLIKPCSLLKFLNLVKRTNRKAIALKDNTGAYSFQSYKFTRHHRHHCHLHKSFYFLLQSTTTSENFCSCYCSCCCSPLSTLCIIFVNATLLAINCGGGCCLPNAIYRQTINTSTTAAPFVYGVEQFNIFN